MGLTVHYTIAHARPLNAADAEALVRTAHRRAPALVRHRLFLLLLGWAAGAVGFAQETERGRPVVQLPAFRVEGTPWIHARRGDTEILSRASAARTRQFVLALERGQRLVPDFAFEGVRLPLKIILVDEPERAIAGLAKSGSRRADVRRWEGGYEELTGPFFDLVGDGMQVVALNLDGIDPLWELLPLRARRLLGAQAPAFPPWMIWGLFGECGQLRDAMGFARTKTVEFAKLSWPDPAVEPGRFPLEATEFPPFAVMFDSAREPEKMDAAARRQFEFQTGLFARWSLFGPAKNVRDPNGYWALAEVARRTGRVTADVFEQCYGMDYARACAEMRTYLKSDDVRILALRLPQIMAGSREIERLEFREPELADVRRLLGEFNRLRAAEAAPQSR